MAPEYFNCDDTNCTYTATETAYGINYWEIDAVFIKEYRELKKALAIQVIKLQPFYK